MPFEPIPEQYKPCLDPEHRPPTHLHIPYGQQYRHTCPTCKQESVIKAMDIVFSAGNGGE
jgi:hypothetical protein